MPVDQHLFILSGLLATAGVATSEVMHITLAAAGLSAFFAAALAAFTALRVAGAVYLTYLGVQALEFLVDGTVGVLAGRIGDWLGRHQPARRRLDVATGSVFIGLGARLAVER